MLWKLFVGFVAFFHPQGAHRSDVLPEHVTVFPYGPQTPEERAIAIKALHGEFQNGDMLFSDEYPADAGMKDPRWPKYPKAGEVPYVIDPSVDSLKPLILKAMDQYHKKTCVKFVPRVNQKDYINIFNGSGCYSYVGRQGTGLQNISLGYGCEYVGTIVHELGHAIGLHHEHQRSDRDTYITVYQNNVAQGMEHNFDLTDEDEEMEFDTSKYDYESIMHYGNHAFSIDPPGNLTTMKAKNGKKLLEPFDKKGFTNTDIALVKKLYQCK